MLEPGCTAGSLQLAQSAARPRAEPADVVGDLGERHGIGAQRAAQETGRVARRLRLEVVARLDERQPRLFRQFGDYLARKSLGCVQPGAHRRSAQSQFVNARKGGLDALARCLHLARIAAELLAHADRHGVLQVRPADLDDAVELFRLARQRRGKLPHGGKQAVHDSLGRGHVHSRGDHVVARLPAVDVVVGVRPRQPADHLVGVHVGRGAAAGLIDIEWKVRVVEPLRDFRGGAGDRRGPLRRQMSHAAR